MHEFDLVYIIELPKLITKLHLPTSSCLACFLLYRIKIKIPINKQFVIPN